MKKENEKHMTAQSVRSSGLSLDKKIQREFLLILSVSFFFGLSSGALFAFVFYIFFLASK